MGICPISAITEKHLLVGGNMTVDKVTASLGSCPDVDDLLWSVHSTQEILPHFREYKLKRLSTNLSTLSLADFRGPAFFHLAHVDVTDLGETWLQWKGLTYMPCLSHVAINIHIETNILLLLLRHCRKLKILIIVGNTWEMSDVVITDPRFVMMSLIRYVVKDWADGASGKGDMWDWAETISSAKQRGLFKEDSLLAT